jgi:hypothetical protein
MVSFGQAGDETRFTNAIVRGVLGWVGRARRAKGFACFVRGTGFAPTCTTPRTPRISPSSSSDSGTSTEDSARTAPILRFLDNLGAADLRDALLRRSARHPTPPASAEEHGGARARRGAHRKHLSRSGSRRRQTRESMRRGQDVSSSLYPSLFFRTTSSPKRKANPARFPASLRFCGDRAKLIAHRRVSGIKN